MSMKKKNVFPLTILTLSLLWLGFYLLFRENVTVMTAICETVVRPFHRFASVVNEALPFSVGELLCYLLVCAVLWLLIRLFRHRRDTQALLRDVLTIAALPALIGAAFTLLWGSYYYAEGFAEKSGLEDRPVSAEELKAVTAKFIDLCNDYGEQVERDDRDEFVIDREAIFDASAHLYDKISRRLPLSNDPAVHCKGVSRLLSYGMSKTGFTGFFCPYTGESNVNTHMPDLLLPATIGHELAHQRGVAREDYANFVGIAASLESGERDYCYSAAVMGYIYLGNALCSADYASWKELYATISPKVRTDLNAHNAYWDRFDGKAEEVSDKLYEKLLETVGETRGMASYGACVDLLVQWYGDAEGK